MEKLPADNLARKAHRGGSTFAVTLGGILFGLLFPILGTLVECLRRDLTDVAGAILVQTETPLLWILDIVPLVLGLAGYLIGIRDVATEVAAIGASETQAERPRQLLPIALGTIVCLAVLLLVYSTHEGQAATRYASDIEKAGTIRDGTLWIYNEVRPGSEVGGGGRGPDALWRRQLANLRQTRENLRERHPDEVRAGDDDFLTFMKALEADASVPWPIAARMWRSADALTYALSDQARARNARAEALLLVGGIFLLGLLPFGILLLRRLWLTEALMAHQHHALTESENRFRSLVEVMSDWMWETDEEARYTYVSPRVADSLGYSPEEMLGKTPFDLMTPNEAARISAQSRQIVASRKSFMALECEVRDRTGRIVSMEVSGTPVFDTYNQFMGYRGINRDITRRREAERERALYQARLEELAAIDPLTGLANRRVFIDRLDDAWERNPAVPLTLILLDADRFKAYNDDFGHLEGDRALLRIAGELTAQVRATDTVARYGGEEFVVLLPDTTADEALRIAERLRNAVASSDWPLRPMTASFGVAVRRPEMRRSSELISAADRALYESKSNGRDRVTLAHDTDSSTSAPRKEKVANDRFASGATSRV